MRSEQYEYNDDPTRLPGPLDALTSASLPTERRAFTRSATSVVSFGIAWLFGLEALLCDDDAKR